MWLAAVVSLWFLGKLWLEGELVGTRQIVFCTWFVVAAMTQYLAQSPGVWVAGVVAQVVLAITLVLKDQLDSTYESMKGILCSVTIALALTALGCGGSTAPRQQARNGRLRNRARKWGSDRRSRRDPDEAAASGDRHADRDGRRLAGISRRPSIRAVISFQPRRPDTSPKFCSITLSSSQTVDFNLPLNPRLADRPVAQASSSASASSTQATRKK